MTEFDSRKEAFTHITDGERNSFTTKNFLLKLTKFLLNRAEPDSPQWGCLQFTGIPHRFPYTVPTLTSMRGINQLFKGVLNWVSTLETFESISLHKPTFSKVYEKYSVYGSWWFILVDGVGGLESYRVYKLHTRNIGEEPCPLFSDPIFFFLHNSPKLDLPILAIY